MLSSSSLLFSLAMAGLLLPGLAVAQQPETGLAGALQTALQPLLSRQPEATVAVAVRDAQTGTTFNLNADRVYHAASTMKVPVMIELYRQAAQGRFSMDDSITVENSFRSIVDGTPYQIGDDSDEAIYDHLGEPMAIRDLLYRMITRSSNLATNLLIDLVRPDSAQATVERLGATTMRVRRGVEDLKAYEQGLNNTTTAADLATILDALQRGDAAPPEATREMLDIMTHLEDSAMIPAGLPAGTRVAHKTGTITAVNHDAAVVYPAGSRPYVLVILTEGIERTETSAALGADLARTVHGVLRPGP